ncbi:sensor domain-containing diguanylate cyclase [Pseudoalteromonas gelatinilytica]|uniref:histidine kinase n=1 Tax=Pseudoalteromonas gelatinilytica TaxID=1703256 RepID=A0ABQ1T7J7_9GAMM|nr:sensor domain-containing diguanylate cyclase [Pseudoalteromonas profundi]GGE83060.1 hypothetical protein GCM10008027_04770 [Pseudoalteromonas profundi]
MEDKGNVNELTVEIKRLRQIIEGTNIGTWEWNVQTGETRFNERWAQILGYTLDEISPINIDTWLNLAHPDDLAESERLLNEHFKGRSPFYHCEARMKHKDGRWVWVRDHGRVVTRNQDGSPEWIVGSHMDITQEKTEQIAAERLNKIASSVPGLIYEFEMDDEGKMSFPYASPGIMGIYGVTPNEAKECVDNVFSKVHRADVAFLNQTILHSAKTLEPWNAEYRVIINGHTRWVTGFARPERVKNGIRWYGLIVDSTESKKVSLQLEESQQRLEQAQTLAHLGHWEANTGTGELYWSPQIFEIFGFEPDKFAPSTKAFYDAVHPDDRGIVNASEEQAKLTGIHDVEHRIIRPDGSIRWVHEYTHVTPQGDDDTNLILIGTVQDVTEKKELELKLIEQSYTDALTQIFNRRYAMAFMQKQFSPARRRSNDNIEGTVISFDIDHFKHVNDTYGHAVGDKALMLLARNVEDILRQDDIFARMGGEEFMIILSSSKLSDGLNLAERVRKLVESIEIPTRSGFIHITVTLAVASYSKSDLSLEDFYIRLDDGLYKGKRAGRNRVVPVIDELNEFNDKSL